MVAGVIKLVTHTLAGSLGHHAPQQQHSHVASVLLCAEESLAEVSLDLRASQKSQCPTHMIFQRYQC